MKKYRKIFAAFLCLLLFALLTVSAAAQEPENESVEEAIIIKAEEELPEAETSEAEPEVMEAAVDEPAPEPLICVKGQELYAEKDTVVFNNGGTVYNNGALVYNNGGLCYNNLGIVYNNGGTVYGNGGTVYNNGGTVYNNGAELYSHDEEAAALPEAEEDAAEAEILPGEEVPEGSSAAETAEEDETERFSVKLAADYSGAVDFDMPLEEGRLSLGIDEPCRISAKPGYVISFAEVDAGTLSLEEDGSYILRDVDSDAVLSIEYRPAKPELKLAGGAYDEEQKLEFEVPEGMTLYFTTDGSKPGEKSEEYSKPIKLKESCLLKAVIISDDGLSSEVSEAAYNILDIKIPEFASEKEGYNEITAKPVVIKNPGTLAAEIKNITLSGKDAADFTISHTAGLRIPEGGSEEEFWKIYPQLGLKKGEYEAEICIAFNTGDELIYDLSFKVK